MSEASLAELLEQERRRIRRKEPTPEQRQRRRAVSAWSSNLFWVWDRAHLATDDELQWLATITSASGVRKGRHTSLVRKTQSDWPRWSVS
jgi:hypothetical protein